MNNWMPLRNRMPALLACRTWYILICSASTVWIIQYCIWSLGKNWIYTIIVVFLMIYCIVYLLWIPCRVIPCCVFRCVFLFGCVTAQAPSSRTRTFLGCGNCQKSCVNLDHWGIGLWHSRSILKFQEFFFGIYFQDFSLDLIMLWSAIHAIHSH